MFKLILFTLTLTLSQNIYANYHSHKCVEKLTSGHRTNTSTKHYNLDHVPMRDFGNDYLAQAIKLIRLHIAELGCSRSSINFGQGPRGRSISRCEQIVRGVYSSRVCYVETNLGYFIVSVGYLDDAVITYHRWD